MNTTDLGAVANFEEIQPRSISSWEEAPLILFTLLGQLAVGGFLWMYWMFPFSGVPAEQCTTFFRLLPLLLIGGFLGAGMLASFTHLGTKKNSWRVLRQLRRSWLSREILFTGLFGTGWLFTTLSILIWQRGTVEWMALTAVLGIGSIHSMAQVYRLPAVPAWNTWRTDAGFLVSALLLGQSLMAVLLAYEANSTGIQSPTSHWIKIGSSILLLLLVQLLLMRKQFPRSVFQNIRNGLILAGMVLTVPTMFLIDSNHSLVSSLIFLVVVIEEGIGRWLFYQSRV